MTELMVVVGLFAILAALAMPAIGVGERVRVNTAASEVRQAMQAARLRAVAVNRPLQLRFNCPAANQIRIVEGCGARPACNWDTQADRCSLGSFPYPAPEGAAYATPELPRYDGPIQYINPRIALISTDPNLVLQFGPDGRVTKIVNGSGQIITTVPVTVSANGYTKTINVNNLGKVVTQ